MVRLTRIYTRTGDKGRTRLGDMSETDKHDPRVEAYGAVDEANAALGVAASALDNTHEVTEIIHKIQNDMFDLGADLCVPDRGETLEFEPLRMTSHQTEQIEAWIDRFNQALEPLNSFILPGGCELASRFHMARTITRRAERCVTLLISSGEPVSQPVLTYLNRLSDLLFVLARWANENGRNDILWKPGNGRS